jgi:hypothetical protein
MVPYYQNRHERQAVGLDGPDLAGQRRRQLLARARGTSRDSIQQFDSTRFHVASESRPGAYYEIDLNRSVCNCPNFPRSRFCKHLGAINVHFPHLCPKENNPPIDLGIGGASNAPQCTPSSDVCRSSNPQEKLQKLKREIKLLSQELDKIEEIPDESAVIEAFRSVKYSLTAAIASTQGSRALPNREVSPPNQNSWTETAERMMWKRAPKRRLPGEHGLTERSIGAPRKRKCLYVDPYAGGERSGRHAKPDALSVEANARARVLQIPPHPNALPSPSVLPPAYPFASTSGAIVCAPGPSTMPFGAFLPTPKFSTAHSFLPGPGNLHALRSAHVPKSRTIEGRLQSP